MNKIEHIEHNTSFEEYTKDINPEKWDFDACFKDKEFSGHYRASEIYKRFLVAFPNNHKVYSYFVKYILHNSDFIHNNSTYNYWYTILCQMPIIEKMYSQPLFRYEYEYKELKETINILLHGLPQSNKCILSEKVDNVAKENLLKVLSDCNTKVGLFTEKNVTHSQWEMMLNCDKQCNLRIGNDRTKLMVYLFEKVAGKNYLKDNYKSLIGNQVIKSETETVPTRYITASTMSINKSKCNKKKDIRYNYEIDNCLEQLPSL